MMPGRMPLPAPPDTPQVDLEQPSGAELRLEEAKRFLESRASELAAANIDRIEQLLTDILEELRAQRRIAEAMALGTAERA